MLVQITGSSADAELQELMEYATGCVPELEEQAWKIYDSPGEAELYVFEEDGKKIGLIGFKMVENQLDIMHLAVHPEERSKGYGREIIIAALLLKQPQFVSADTDEEGADFFRNIGFRVTGFIPPSGGAEQFHCVYEAEEVPED